MPIETDIEPAHHAPMVDGEVNCWRCEYPVDQETRYCDSCGAVTLPTDSGRADHATSSTAAVGRQPIMAALDLEPAPSLNALDPDIAAGLGCEV